VSTANADIGKSGGSVFWKTQPVFGSCPPSVIADCACAAIGKVGTRSDLSPCKGYIGLTSRPGPRPLRITWLLADPASC
jgi:hypothetical protein